MSRTYKTTGINLKGVPLGEYDRLLTLLTPEYGIIRVVAPGARKHQSKLGARSGVFVVNELLIVKGKSLDKIIQAETVESYPKLGQDLSKLTVSQYLAELVLYQALSDQPQVELFERLRFYLAQLEQSASAASLFYLVHGIFHLLAMAGLEPQVYDCCLTQTPIEPEFDASDWQVGFSSAAGGVVSLDALERLEAQQHQQVRAAIPSSSRSAAAPSAAPPVGEATGRYRAIAHRQPLAEVNRRIGARELQILQTVAQVEQPVISVPALEEARSQSSQSVSQSVYQIQADWLSVERVLRHYAQYHFERPIRSAALIESCFAPILSTSSSS